MPSGTHLYSGFCAFLHQSVLNMQARPLPWCLLEDWPYAGGCWVGPRLARCVQEGHTHRLWLSHRFASPQKPRCPRNRSLGLGGSNPRWKAGVACARPQERGTGGVSAGAPGPAKVTRGLGRRGPPGSAPPRSAGSPERRGGSRSRQGVARGLGRRTWPNEPDVGRGPGERSPVSRAAGLSAGYTRGDAARGGSKRASPMGGCLGGRGAKAGAPSVGRR
jgi:hypothetical protein